LEWGAGSLSGLHSGTPKTHRHQRKGPSEAATAAEATTAAAGREVALAAVARR
jgi:hypothetical protein